MPRTYARAKFSNPPVIEAEIHLLDGSVMLQKDSKIVIHDIGLQGIRFSSEKAFAIGDLLIMHISLFSPINHLTGEVIWTTQDEDTYNYGLKIITSDCDYFQFMHSYDTYKKEHQYDPQ